MNKCFTLTKMIDDIRDIYTGIFKIIDSNSLLGRGEQGNRPGPRAYLTKWF